jgi:hypothetical protein
LMAWMEGLAAGPQTQPRQDVVHVFAANIYESATKRSHAGNRSGLSTARRCAASRA